MTLFLSLSLSPCLTLPVSMFKTRQRSRRAERAHRCRRRLYKYIVVVVSLQSHHLALLRSESSSHSDLITYRFQSQCFSTAFLLSAVKDLSSSSPSPTTVIARCHHNKRNIFTLFYTNSRKKWMANEWSERDRTQKKLWPIPFANNLFVIPFFADYNKVTVSHYFYMKWLIWYNRIAKGDKIRINFHFHFQYREYR